MSKLITNKQTLLKEVINNILPTSDNLRFLVGYFYFSGFEKLVDRLRDKKVKILVGMDIERKMLGAVRQYIEIEQKSNPSRQSQKESFYNDFVSIFNESDFFDTRERIRAFEIYLEKLKDGTLEIRKTKNPHHAKLYLFEKLPEYNEGGEYPGVLITGSSNLSHSGLGGRAEINIQLRERSSYTEAKDIFDNLWEASITLADQHHIPEFQKKVIEKIWYKKIPSPYLMYIRVLEEYFSLIGDDEIRLPSEMTKGKYLNFEYQIDAIKQGKKSLEKHNGVIIADVVGLGKSIIASALAHDLNLETIIICPPHLERQWKEYRYDFNLKAKIFSTHISKIEKALAFDRKNGKTKLIIIDEAHRFRNEESSTYGVLHELCQNNKIILLSATPFNNRPQDIFSMVKLFQVPAKSTLQTIDNLSFRFKALIREYKNITKEQREGTTPPEEINKKIKSIAERIRRMIEPVVVRRSRIDLEKIDRYRDDLEELGISLHKPEPPVLLEYELGDVKPLYLETLEKIVPSDQEKSGYQATRYMPLAYIKEEFMDVVQESFGEERIDIVAQKNVANFMKRLLVKRFESSMPAFLETLDNLIHSAKNIKHWYEYHGKIPILKKGNVPDITEEILSEWSEEEIKQYFNDISPYEEYQESIDKGMHLIDSAYIREEYLEDLISDLKLLEEIKQKWLKENPEDPKIKFFLSHIAEKFSEMPERKIIIFSEFGDTVNYLYHRLKKKYRVMKYIGNEATKPDREKVAKNFDAGIPNNEQEDQYDILIATDAISEGVNLHRAGVIYNYDIPYNPTKVIQRIGRLNRIDKKTYSHIYVYNFFPSGIGEKETRTKAISTLKMQMIHTLLGEDMQVLTPDEDIASVFNRQYKRILELEEQASWDTKYRQELENIKQIDKEKFKQAMDLPRRTKIQRKKKFGKSGVLLFAEKGGEYIFIMGYSPTQKDQVVLTAEEALSFFKANKKEDAKQPSETFYAIYQELRKNLFIKRTETKKSPSLQAAINQVEYLLENTQNDQDYLKDLIRALRDLEGISKRHIKDIKNINLQDLDKAISDLKTIVNPIYVKDVIASSEKVEEGDERLILAQEIRKQ
jgi:superfamily II DNA or RNA helicase